MTNPIAKAIPAAWVVLLASSTAPARMPAAAPPGNAQWSCRVPVAEFQSKRHAIAEIRDSGASAVHKLVAILVDSPDGHRRRLAAQALGELQPSDEASRALVRWVFDADPCVRGDAVFALKKTSGAPKDVVDALIRVLKTDDVGFIRLQAALVLGALRPLTAPALDALTDALTGTSIEGRIGAADAIDTIGQAAKGALPALVQALNQAESGTEVSSVVSAMASLGETPRDAVPGLLRSARDSDGESCELTAKVLARVGTAALPELTAALKDDDPHVRMLAALVLKDMDHPAGLKPLVDAALKDYEREREADRITPDDD